MQKSELAKILKTIGEDKRLEILCTLFRTGNKNICVSEIAKNINSTIATTSHHLKTLEKNNILESERVGKEICYKIKKGDLLKDIKNLICKNINF